MISGVREFTIYHHLSWSPKYIRYIYSKDLKFEIYTFTLVCWCFDVPLQLPWSQEQCDRKVFIHWALVCPFSEDKRSDSSSNVPKQFYNGAVASCPHHLCVQTPSKPCLYPQIDIGTAKMLASFTNTSRNTSFFVIWLIFNNEWITNEMKTEWNLRVTCICTICSSALPCPLKVQV